jgi:hypothetical protein
LARAQGANLRRSFARREGEDIGRITGPLIVYATCVREPEEAGWDVWEDDVHLPAHQWLIGRMAEIFDREP